MSKEFRKHLPSVFTSNGNHLIMLPSGHILKGLRSTTVTALLHHLQEHTGGVDPGVAGSERIPDHAGVFCRY